MSAKKEALLRILLFFCLSGIIGIYSLTNSYSKNIHRDQSSSAGVVTYRVPYKNSLDYNLGYVPEPLVTFPLKTKSGFVNTSFLLDTGAIISTLPLQTAKDLGVDLVSARRISLKGFGGMPVFAYLDNITIQIADQEFILPATFTEISKTNILGRKGLLEYFTVNFDNEKKAVTLSRQINI